ncbi:MAG: trypsin-like peptidase domain-containing protein [Candidatus Levybacteria bacterium]|nr:trypsin-like peptidase domain-containing protein [Candidatus Levybacteria bacterium]
MRRLIILVVILVVLSFSWSAVIKYSPQFSGLFQKQSLVQLPPEKVKVLTEESVVIDTVKKVGPSVVTVSETRSQTFSPFDFGPFSIFGMPQQDQEPPQPQNIGTGFIVSEDGFIVTNKHVVSDTAGKYQVITSNDKKYDVQKIYRDPLNDVAILKIDANQNSGTKLKTVVLGDSSRLQVGQFVIAIGTALGEFRNTVTTGVISGLGRGITAGSEFQGFVERLDNVIQTDAAINPGNSGGPLLNSSGQVIGINTAVASSGQNIGFALPISVVKDSLKNFNETGQFNRPYLGVAYKMINKDLALLNDVPEGAYVQNVIKDSASDKAGVEQGDIITKIDGQRITGEKGELAKIIGTKKVGDSLKIEIWRLSSTDDGSGKTMELTVTLETAPTQ